MQKKLIVGIGIFVLLAGMLGSTVLAAPPQQWFPADGTGVDYSLAWSLAYFNGTRAIDSKFDVYKSNSSDFYYLIATWQDSNLWVKSYQPSWILLDNTTTITLHHAYSSASASTLNRTASIKTHATTISKGTITLLIFYNKTGSTSYLINLQSDLVQKSGFFTSSQSFLDHFDNSLIPGESFLVPLDYVGHSIVSATIQTKTDNAIVGQYIYSDHFNITYVASGSGQVQSYSEIGSYYPFWPDIRCWYASFTLVAGSNNALPGSLPVIVIGVLGVVSVLWIWKKHHDLGLAQGVPAINRT